MFRPYFCYILSYLFLLSLLVSLSELLQSAELFCWRKYQYSCLLYCLSYCCYFCKLLKTFAFEVMIIYWLAYSSWKNNWVSKRKVRFSYDSEVLMSFFSLILESENETGCRSERFESVWLWHRSVINKRYKNQKTQRYRCFFIIEVILSYI